MKYEIDLERPKEKFGTSSSDYRKANNNNSHQVSALVKSERGDRLQGRFTFELESDKNNNSLIGTNRIKALHIQFI